MADNKIVNATGVYTRICQGTYGNYSVAESRIPLAGLASGDHVTLFTLPQGVRLYAIRFFSKVNLSAIKVNDHKLSEDFTAAEVGAAHYFEPYTTQQHDEDVTVTLSAAGSDELICVIEYVFEGAA